MSFIFSKIREKLINSELIWEVINSIDEFFLAKISALWVFDRRKKMKNDTFAFYISSDRLNVQTRTNINVQTCAKWKANEQSILMRKNILSCCTLQHEQPCSISGHETVTRLHYQINVFFCRFCWAQISNHLINKWRVFCLECLADSLFICFFFVVSPVRWRLFKCDHRKLLILI